MASRGGRAGRTLAQTELSAAGRSAPVAGTSRDWSPHGRSPGSSVYPRPGCSLTDALSMSRSKPAIPDVLRAAPLFKPLIDSEIELLAARSVSQTFAPGQMLFSESEACKGL